MEFREIPPFCLTEKPTKAASNKKFWMAILLAGATLGAGIFSNEPYAGRRSDYLIIGGAVTFPPGTEPRTLLADPEAPQKQIETNAPQRGNSLESPGYVLQVAAMAREENAIALAEILQRKNFACLCVQTLQRPTLQSDCGCLRGR